MRKAFLLVILVAPLAADTKVVKVKHRSAESLQRVLAGTPLSFSFSREFNTITLNGSQEQIKVVEAILEQFDTPRQQAEFLIRVIEASAAAQGPNDAAEFVPTELKALVKYQRYSLLDSAVARGLEGEGPLRLALASNMSGSLWFSARESMLECRLNITGPPMIIKDKGNDTSHSPTLLDTTATLKSGETAVLGASKMRGGTNALIVLLTAKLLP
jgi:hypothetical protein